MKESARGCGGRGRERRGGEDGERKSGNGRGSERRNEEEKPTGKYERPDISFREPLIDVTI